MGTLRRLGLCIVAGIPLLCVGGCQKAIAREQIAGIIQTALTGKPQTPSAAVWSDVREFYQRRGNEPAWIDRSLLKAAGAVSALKAAPSHGFAASEYGVDALAARLEALNTGTDDPELDHQLADLDLRITTALLRLGRDVALGRSQPVVVDARWKPRRDAPDFVELLEQSAGGDVAATWLESVRPRHPEYTALQQALGNLRAQLEKGGWPAVPLRKFVVGESHAAVGALRRRLTASGELTGAAAAASNEYDADVESAVRAFQEHHALKATGVIDNQTIAAMNVSIDDRIRQVEINLERWRWMPDDFGARHFLVNIPSYTLLAREDGKTVLDIRVVVGKRGLETPIFSADMVNVVFSPYWNVPDSIAEGETAPAAARDPNYLARNEMEVLRVTKSGTTPVDPSTIDWNDPSQFRDLVFRQKPGAKNALGHVKFLFPNPYNVYLHDTPTDSLFARPTRAFSHGCVRVEEPEALANYVLRGDPDWDETRIARAMQSGVEKYVKLHEPIAVHIVYFTAWVDENAGLHFQPDAYGYDAKQVKLTRRT